MAPFVYLGQPSPSFAYTALPSPPLLHPSKLSNIINLSHSPTTSHSKQTRGTNTTNLPLLPPIHRIALPPPSPSNNSIISPNSISCSPSPSSTFLSFSYELPLPPSAPRQQNGSIQSLLNSPPELKRLDEEEHKFGYNSHFINPGVKRKNTSYPHPPLESSTKKSKSCSSNINRRYDAISSYTSTITSFSSSSTSIKGGLRHFSKQVCDKVKAHGITTFDQVVHEISCSLSSSPSSPWFDQKNVRRRVYDALNVLMAMDIITKVKKEIKWLGIPSRYQHYALNDTDDGDGNTDLLLDSLLDSDDPFLVQQIWVEEARKKSLLASLSATRLDIQKSLTKYSQLLRLIYQNQREPGLIDGTSSYDAQ